MINKIKTTTPPTTEPTIIAVWLSIVPSFVVVVDDVEGKFSLRGASVTSCSVVVDWMLGGGGSVGNDAFVVLEEMVGKVDSGVVVVEFEMVGLVLLAVSITVELLMIVFGFSDD